ncbi:unnamed protein product [Adineta ricciae]|uniref:G-protein coupled receptors family 1 profile domain-containing protein n=1 Tax=Adineta ricciae TaxID=249248 RepID=A0A814XEG1_ADIRI|nr:unnamed protein product [Adineta ricciae]CAF1253792.1 unnamed protein product [Adineta ricciae]
MSTTSTLVLIQSAMNRYVLPIILGFGNMGNFGLIMVYVQKKFRTNTCAIYLIASSIFSLIGANWSIIPLVVALDYYDLVNKSLVFCRARGYIIQTCAQCFRYILVLRCADRYALSSTSVAVRAYSQRKFAFRGIAIVVIVWAILSAQLLIWESIENGKCGIYGLFGQIFAIYIIVFTSFLPLFLMIVFGSMLANNLRHLRTKVQPQGDNPIVVNNNNPRLNKRDASLMRLVLVEVLIYVCCTFSFPIMQIYNQVTSSMNSSKSTQQKQIESFINFMIQSFLLYLNYSTTFYVYLLTSKAFRNEVKQLLMKYTRKIHGNAHNQPDEINSVARVQRERQVKTTTTV